MNFFLHINKRVILFSGILIIFIFIGVIIYKQINVEKVELRVIKNHLPNADISKPKFTINNEKKKIYITASEGNFLNKDEILLKKNVRFKSNDFTIETDNVIFNRNNQTAQSKTRSFFKSKNTLISSDGFNIYDQGNKIIFYGSSNIILK